MKNKHTYSSASSAYRWLNCTKSIQLVKLVPEPEQSIYAEEGTKAHEELATIVNRYINNADKFLGYLKPEWRVFLDHLDEHNLETIEIEQKVEFCGIQGSIDYNWKQGRILHIRDLKWGEGQVVEAIGNSQLIIYALGLLNFYGAKYIDEVIVGIYQPRKNLEQGESPFTFWSLDIQTLAEYARKISEVMSKVKKNELEYKQGEWCSWCPAFPICPEYKKKHAEIVRSNSKGLPIPENLDISQVEQIAFNGNEVIKWIEAVQRLAYRYAMNGTSFENLKLVNGRSSRQWKQSEEQTANELISIGVKDPWVRKLKGLTEIEAEIGKNKINHLTIKPEPKPTLVSIEDKRQAITLATPEDVFGDI